MNSPGRDPDLGGHADDESTEPELSAEVLAAREPDDHALLDVLGEALQEADPVPTHVVAAAHGAVAWRTIDEDLASLVFDSAEELTGVRDDGGPARQLTFRSKGVEIEIMLVDSAQRRLVGQLVPPQSTTVSLEGTDERFEQTTDRLGRFSFDRVHAGPVRLNVSGAEGSRPITTDWVLL